MTQVATQITFSVADRISEWSRQQRELAITLRGSLGTTRPASETWPDDHPSASEPCLPIEVDEPLLALAQPAPVNDGHGMVIGHMAPSSSIHGPLDHLAVHRVAEGPTDPMEGVEQPLDLYEAVTPLPLAPPAPSGPFDDFITALTESAPPPAPAAALPPPSRFMVRVAPVGRPHRATKRNYDYFEALNSNLAARSTVPPGDGRP